MEFIKNILDNAWFISIVTGFIVYIITKLVFERTGKKQHIKQIKEANKKIISSMRGYVVDVEIPSVTIINSIRKVVADEYGVKENEIYDIKKICEVLIEEVISNVYVSKEAKRQYSKQLEEYINRLKEIEKEKTMENSANQQDNAEKYVVDLEKISRWLSYIAAALTAIASFLSVGGQVNAEVDFRDLLESVVIIIATLSIMIITKERFIKGKRKKCKK